MIVLYVVVCMLSGAALIDYGFNRVNFLIFVASLTFVYFEAAEINERLQSEAADVGSTDVGSTDVGSDLALHDRITMAEDNVGVQLDALHERLGRIEEQLQLIIQSRRLSED